MSSIPLIPGSLTKLLITAAVMDIAHKDGLSLDTVIATDGHIDGDIIRGNLYLKGSGNASLSMADLKKAVDALRSMGVKEITGDVISDDSVFQTNGWSISYHGPAYAPPSGLGLDMHTISITASNSQSKVTIDPPNDTVKTLLTLEGQEDIQQIDDLTYTISRKPELSGTVKKRFALHAPAIYAGGALATLLRETEIAVKGTSRSGKEPPQITELLRIPSKEMGEIIRDINKYSLNTFSDNLFLMLGAKRFGKPGTAAKGRDAVRDFLMKLGLPAEDIVIADGSGLSSANRITSEQMVAFLKKISEKPWFASFYESLPRAGMDGTLAYIGYKNEHIRAKTGQLRDVFCIAGYIGDNMKDLVAFAYLVNVPGAELLGNSAMTKLLRGLGGEGS